MTKIKYDKDVKILSIRLSNKKSVDSGVSENIVVDYDKDGKVVNLDIMNISLDEFLRVKSFVEKITNNKLRELVSV